MGGIRGLLKGRVDRQLESKQSLWAQEISQEIRKAESLVTLNIPENWPPLEFEMSELQLPSGYSTPSSRQTFSSEPGVGQMSFCLWLVTWHTAWLFALDIEEAILVAGGVVVCSFQRIIAFEGLVALGKKLLMAEIN